MRGGYVPLCSSGTNTWVGHGLSASFCVHLHVPLTPLLPVSCRVLLNTPCAACPSFQQPRQEAAAEVEGAATAGDEDDVEWLESMGDLDLRTVLDDPNLTLAGARTGQTAGGGRPGGAREQGGGCSALVLTCRISL